MLCVSIRTKVEGAPMFKPPIQGSEIGRDHDLAEQAAALGAENMLPLYA